MIQLPRIVDWTSAPLQNRVRFRLDATPERVWDLVGDLARLPDYIPGPVDVDAMLWYQPERGYASRATGDSSLGLPDDVNVVTLDPVAGGTLVTWDEYFHAEDVGALRASYAKALDDIVEQLIERFGGDLLERYVAAPSTPSGAEVVVAALAAAVNVNDLEGAMALYEPSVVMVGPDGVEARGRDAVRESMAQFLALRPTLETIVSLVVTSGDLASYVGRWTLTGIGPDGAPVRMGGESADVLRRQPDGRWLIALDNPWGASVLGATATSTPTPEGRAHA